MSVLEQRLKPKALVSDFEVSIHQSAKEMFSDITIVGCRLFIVSII